MPFLCVFPKRRVSEERVDAARLAGLLCPYRGDLRRFDVPRGILYASSLVGVRLAADSLSPTSCVIPEGTRHNPQTSWLRIDFDESGVRFETDPLGTFPLYWYEDDAGLVVTGELKALTALSGARIAFASTAALEEPRRPPDFCPCPDVHRVFPGAILRVSPNLETTVERRSPLTYQPARRARMVASEAEAKALLDAALVESARSMTEGEDGARGWGAFLSGGIDSSLASALVKRRVADLSTFTLGTEYGDEYADAEDFASYLGAPHTRIMATPADAVAHFDRAVFCNETIDGLTAETLAQLGILVQAASRQVRRIVTGYGADLLFGSMLRHELYMAVTGVADLQSLIERTCWSGEFSPFFAWSLGVELHHLFWHPQVMNAAFRVPEAMSFDGAREKIALRNLATEGGYMEPRHAHRRKQAMTDGTQFNRLLSTSLGFRDAFSYPQKNERCVSELRRIIERDRT